jgi:endonuclease/exonuclease/phosphatase family metal-dependent hydrolase
MKIATWNLERPNYSSKTRNTKIIEVLNEVDADILILTETNTIINPGNAYTHFTTSSSKLLNQPYYKEGENRTTIWSKYPANRNMETYDGFTSICIGIKTPLGDLNVYGTIIGIHGNRRESFNKDLEKQLVDWRRISQIGNICVAGDFNISFGDNYYYTKEGRQKINTTFEELKIENLTQHIPENIDHIAIASSFIKSKTLKTSVWNENKKLSDHIGVCVTLE